MKLINRDFITFKSAYLIVLIFMIGLIFIYSYKIHTSKNYNNKGKNKLQTASYVNNNININQLKVIAHRGVCSNETENSLEAIQASIDNHVDYAEIDVQETKDGVVVLMHDKSLKRLTGLNKNVNQLTYAQVEKLNIGKPYLNKITIEKIPTLDEVIKKSNGKLHLIIEIKPYGNTDELTNKVVKIIEQNNFVSQCMIHSLNYRILLNVKKLNSNIITGYILTRPNSNVCSLNVDFYSVQQGTVTQTLVSNIHKSNKKIYAWTVDNQSSMDKMLMLKVDGIITDKPILLLNKKKLSIRKA